jgi:hypothetical protein
MNFLSAFLTTPQRQLIKTKRTLRTSVIALAYVVWVLRGKRAVGEAALGFPLRASS